MEGVVIKIVIPSKDGEKKYIAVNHVLVHKLLVEIRQGGTPTEGDTYRGNIYGATGNVVGSSYTGGGEYVISVTLDDCNKPVAQSDTITFSNGATMTGVNATPPVSNCRCICTQMIDWGQTKPSRVGNNNKWCFFCFRYCYYYGYQ